MSDQAVGYAACGVASLFFGTMFVPVKKYDPKDGIFVQFIMGCAILCVGIIVFAIEHFPPVYPLAMLGGALWAIGNVTAVPIIGMIGMAMGILLWSSTNLLIGWASGRFGWFGINPEPPESALLNDIGLVLSIASAIIFIFVKSKPSSEVEYKPLSEAPSNGSLSAGNEEALITQELPPAYYDSLDDTPLYPSTMKEKIVYIYSTNWQRIIGILVSLVAGIFYGATFAPVIYIQDHAKNCRLYNLSANGTGEYCGAPEAGLPYVFSHYLGIFLTCTFFFIVYAIFKRNKPWVQAEIVLPSFVCGLMWAVAQAAFFVANERLSEAVSFPIITRLPGVIASLWGVFYFREIQGRKNLIILVVAIIITVIAGVLTGLSKSIST